MELASVGLLGVQIIF